MAVGACTASAPSAPASGPVARTLQAAADEAGVPGDLLTAIAIEERGIRLPALRTPHDDGFPFAGMLELRRGRLDTLALGARLVGASEQALQQDTELATRAGAHVVAQLGATADPATWRPALEALSGMDDAMAHDYASRVLRLLREGGEGRGRDGELVKVAPHPEIDPSEAIESRLVAPVDYPGAIPIPTSCANTKCTVGRPLGNDSVDKIVIHDTECDWDVAVATLQNDGGKSVHYIIDFDGSRVGQFRAETDTTYHAGNFFYNETSIGIEHVGVAADPAGYSAELYATSRALVQDIRSRWNIPLDRQHIVGHYQIPDGSRIAEDSPACADTLDACENSANFGGANNHRDPGYYWQWCQYMQKLGGSCTCNDAWDHWNCTTDKTQAVRCADGMVQIMDCTAGCEVQPIGTDDVCNVLPGGGDGTPDAGAGGGDDEGGGGGGGGCSSSRGGDLLALALVLVTLVARRRR
ncbi:MAG TPA: peptidoglycan recognition family protein [Kofleriaceae bacterium]|nr:peptidoglycan recognition family protein [Kofleriaceae bacterium]